MSMHFFNKTLNDAKALIEQALKEKNYQARKQLYSEAINIIEKHTQYWKKEDEEKERIAFKNLIDHSRDHQNICVNFVNGAKAKLDEWEKQDTNNPNFYEDRVYMRNKKLAIDNAIRVGQLAVKYAKEVSKLCKDEELDLK